MRSPATATQSCRHVYFITHTRTSSSAINTHILSQSICLFSLFTSPLLFFSLHRLIFILFHCCSTSLTLSILIPLLIGLLSSSYALLSCALHVLTTFALFPVTPSHMTMQLTGFCFEPSASLASPPRKSKRIFS